MKKEIPKLPFETFPPAMVSDNKKHWHKRPHVCLHPNDDRYKYLAFNENGGADKYRFAKPIEEKSDFEKFLNLPLNWFLASMAVGHDPVDDYIGTRISSCDCELVKDGIEGGGIEYFYRESITEDWKPISDFQPEGE